MDCHSFLLAIVPVFRYDEKKRVDSDGFALKSDAAAPDGKRRFYEEISLCSFAAGAGRLHNRRGVRGGSDAGALQRPDEQVTGQMRAERLAMLEKYPGLTIVDPAAIDPGEEIIYVDGLEGLDALMSGISAIHLYTGR